MTARNGKRIAKRRHRLPAGVLDDIVQRVVKAARPEKIILFGSAARGTMGPDSDFDLLVIKRGKFNRARVEEASYRAMWGVGAPVDIVVVTSEEVEQYRDASCLVIYPALREGKVVYAE
jgi:predicted nucleotidyltransferase